MSGLIGAGFGLAGLVVNIAKLFRKAGPTDAERVGAAITKVDEGNAANAELAAAAAARATADATRVRSDPHAGDVNTDPAAPVNNLPNEHFRD